MLLLNLLTVTATSEPIDFENAAALLCDFNSNLYNGCASGVTSCGFEDELPDGKQGFILYNDTNVVDDDTARVLISAPHAQETFRYDSASILTYEEPKHPSEPRLGALAMLLHNITGVPAIRKNWKSDDPNYYNTIPAETKTTGWSDNVGEIIPYKVALADYLSKHPNIFVVLDLHGASSEVSKWPNGEVPVIDLGTGGENDESVIHDKGQETKEAVLEVFNDLVFHDLGRPAAVNNRRFAGCCAQETITKWASQPTTTHPRVIGLNALQIEIGSDYRSCSSSSTTPNRLRLKKLTEALIGVVNKINEIYKDAYVRCEEPSHCVDWDTSLRNCAGMDSPVIPCTKCSTGYYLGDGQCKACKKKSRCKNAEAKCYKDTKYRDCEKCDFGWWIRSNNKCKFLGLGR